MSDDGNFEKIIPLSIPQSHKLARALFALPAYFESQHIEPTVRKLALRHVALGNTAMLSTNLSLYAVSEGHTDIDGFVDIERIQPREEAYLVQKTRDDLFWHPPSGEAFWITHNTVLQRMANDNRRLFNIVEPLLRLTDIPNHAFFAAFGRLPRAPIKETAVRYESQEQDFHRHTVVTQKIHSEPPNSFVTHSVTMEAPLMIDHTLVTTSLIFSTIKRARGKGITTEAKVKYSGELPALEHYGENTVIEPADFVATTLHALDAFDIQASLPPLSIQVEP